MRALVLLALVACSASPPPASHPLPATDAGTGSPCAMSCARRAELGCLEAALAPVCVQRCEMATADRFFHPECILAATTREDLARCRVRCAP